MPKRPLKNKSIFPVARSFSPGEIRAGLLAWFANQHVEYPWRRLRHDPYAVWVSEIMLQQTQASTVQPVFSQFIRQYPTVQKLAHSTAQELREAVRGLGYYRRFDLLHRASKIVAESGGMPRYFDDWLALPGIGPYTAAAISSIAFNDRRAVVDGNVERIYARLFDVRLPVNDPLYKREVQTLADELIDPQEPGEFNQALMVLGQRVCRPNGTPNCSECPLRAWCLARSRDSMLLSPGPKEKPPSIAVKARLTIPVVSGRVGLLTRPGDAKFLAGIEGFFTELADADGTFQRDGSLRLRDLNSRKTQRIGSIKHSITKHRIVADVSVAMLSHPPKVELEWLSLSDVEPKLVSNLDRKALKLITGDMFGPSLFE